MDLFGIWPSINCAIMSAVQNQCYGALSKLVNKAIEDSSRKQQLKIHISKGDRVAPNIPWEIKHKEWLAGSL